MPRKVSTAQIDNIRRETQKLDRRTVKLIKETAESVRDSIMKRAKPELRLPVRSLRYGNSSGSASSSSPCTTRRLTWVGG